MTTPDFIDVQLTEAGKRAAGSGSLGVANAHFHYEFRPGAVVRVTRGYEWKVLSQVTAGGEALLEIAPPPAKAPSPTPPKQQKPADEAQGA